MRAGRDRPQHRIVVRGAVPGRVASGAADRVSALVADAELQKGAPVAPTAGAIHEPSEVGATVEGGVRDRMKKEDAARHD